jgi:hypothetical protein
MPSHKVLKSITRSIADSFTSLMNYSGDDYVMGHIVFESWRTSLRKIEIDLLNKIYRPQNIGNIDIITSIESYCSRFKSIVKRSNSDISFIKSAKLEILVFDNKRRCSNNSEYFESQYECTMVIIDDRDKKYKTELGGWWYPEKKVDNG